MYAYHIFQTKYKGVHTSREQKYMNSEIWFGILYFGATNQLSVGLGLQQEQQRQVGDWRATLSSFCLGIFQLILNALSHDASLM